MQVGKLSDVAEKVEEKRERIVAGGDKGADHPLPVLIRKTPGVQCSLAGTVEGGIDRDQRN